MIVTVADPTAIVPPPVGFDSWTVKSRFGPWSSFQGIGMLIVLEVGPGAKVSVPLVAV